MSKVLLALFTFALAAFSEDVRIYTPKDTVPVPGSTDGKSELRVTKEWVAHQASQNPDTTFFWRTSPSSLERIEATPESTPAKKSAAEQHGWKKETIRGESSARSVGSVNSADSEKLYTYSRSSYVRRPKPKKDIVIIEEGEWLPSYDRRTGEMKYKRATYARVQEMAGRDNHVQYAFRRRSSGRSSTSDPARERYTDGTPADSHLKNEYKKLDSQGYGTRYQKPSRAVVERSAQQSRRASEKASRENLWGKPLDRLPSR